MTIQQRASVKLDVPVKVSDLAEFMATVPADAELTVGVFTENQRDPYDVAYQFTAKWGA